MLPHPYNTCSLTETTITTPQWNIDRSDSSPINVTMCSFAYILKNKRMQEWTCKYHFWGTHLKKKMKRIYLIVKCMFLAAINTRTTKWILYQPHFKSKYSIYWRFTLSTKKFCFYFEHEQFWIITGQEKSFKPNYFPESLSVVIQTRIIHLELTWGMNYLIFCGDHMLLQFHSQ